MGGMTASLAENMLFLVHICISQEILNQKALKMCLPMPKPKTSEIKALLFSQVFSPDRHFHVPPLQTFSALTGEQQQP